MAAVTRARPGDLSDLRVDGDQLVAAPELALPFGDPFAVAGVQWLVARDNPQPGDPVVPTPEVEQPGHLGDEGVGHEVTVLVDPRGPRPGGQALDGVHLGVGARPADRELPGPPRYPGR